MEKIEEDKKAKLIQLLKELAEIQANNMKLQVAIFVREAKNQVNMKTTEFVESIQESARNFGPKARKFAETLIENYKEGNNTEAENIIDRYQKALEDINEAYSSELKGLLEKKSKLQEEEIRSIQLEAKRREDRKKLKDSREHRNDLDKIKELKSIIRRARISGETEYAEEQTSFLKKFIEERPITNVGNKIREARENRRKIRRELKECEKEIKDCRRRRDEDIKRVTSEKNRELASSATPIRRFLGSILNRINGVNNFKNIVLKKMEDRIDTIRTEDIPKIKENIEKRKIEISKRLQEAQNTARETVETGKEKITEAKETAVETGKTIIEKGKEGVASVTSYGKYTFNSIIQKGHDIKGMIISKIQEEIANSREKNSALAQEYDEHKPKHLRKVKLFERSSENEEYKSKHFKNVEDSEVEK